MKHTTTSIAFAFILATGCGSSNNSAFDHHQPRVSESDNDSIYGNTPVEHHQPRVSESDKEPIHGSVPGLLTLAFTFGSPLDYSLDDFWLDDEVLYWELRARHNDDPSSSTAWTYDAQSREALSENQKAALESTDSEHGLKPCLQLEDCVIYGAAVTQDGTQILSTTAEFLAFLSPINSEAKLHLWLWANDYEGHTYEVVDAGYKAVVQVVDLWCVEDRYYLVFVDTNGVITETETLITKAPEVCA